jgi:hypothetical protein
VPSRHGRYVQIATAFDPQAAGLMKHYDALGKQGLGTLVQSSPEPGEIVVGCFDATTSWPTVWHRSQLVATFVLLWTLLALLHASFGASGHALVHEVLFGLEVGAAYYVVTQIWVRITKSRRLTFVLTTHGLLSFENRRFNRPRVLRARMTVVYPTLVRQARYWMSKFYRQVRLGDELVWVHRRTDWVLRSMSLRRA